jgi:peroxiredoxin
MLAQRQFIFVQRQPQRSGPPLSPTRERGTRGEGAGQQAPATLHDGPTIGDPAPAFTLPDTQGKTVRLDEFRGKPLLLNFWAFWCDTWKAELPGLKELAARQKDLGFKMVAVSVDGTRVQEFERLTHGSVPFPVLLDVGGKLSAACNVHHVPTVVVIDAAGIVRYTCVGFPGVDPILHEIRRGVGSKR